MSLVNAPPQLYYTNVVPYIDQWGQRVGIPLTSADALGNHYARARNWLLELRTQLIHHHGWRDVVPGNPRMLYTIECPTPHRSSTGLPRSPNMRLEIPAHASTFFNPERQLQWQMIFHSAIFPAMRHTVQPIADLLYLLQCLLTGMLILVKEENIPGEGTVATSRGLPPADWISAHQGPLVDILGPMIYNRLLRAASDNRVAFMLGKPPPPTSGPPKP